MVYCGLLWLSMEIEGEQQEKDDNESTTLPEPMLQAAPVVYKGRIICALCFASTDKTNAGRAGMERIKDIEKFREEALKREGYEHEFNKIYKRFN